MTDRPRTLPIPAPGVPPAPRVPVPERFALENGLRVVAVPRGGLPEVVLRLIVPAGSTVEPPELAGTASLTGRLLTEGTARYTADELNARLDRLGASLEVHVGHDFAEIELFLLSETLHEALPLLGEVVLRPSFPAAETERVREEALDGLASRHDEPANVADDTIAAAVFGGDHPYGRISSGTPSGVRAVSRKALRRFHHERYRPEGSVLVAAGDFDAGRLADLLADALGDWAGAPAGAGDPPARQRAARAGERIDVPWRGAQQTEIRVGAVGLARNSPDWVGAAVANYILGGSTITGRLGANLREDKGWTYGARSSFSGARAPGGWVADAAVDVAFRDAAVREIEREIERMIDEPVGDEELRRAQEALVLSLPRAFETAGRIANRFVTLEAFGLEVDYWERFPERVRSVTAEEVRRLASRYFDPAAAVQVRVG